MTETKFTPAPWTADNYDIVVIDEEDDVACVATTVNSDFTDAVNVANARLIAMAPELLEALETAVKDLCDYCPADMTKKEKRACRLCNRIDQWKKLITKARGDNE